MIKTEAEISCWLFSSEGQPRMNATAEKVSCVSKILCLAPLLAMFSLFGQAQTTNSESSEVNETVKKGKSSKLDFYAETNFEYNDNIYRLTESQILAMNTNAAEDAAGGRYKGMDSVSDYIVAPTIGLKANTRSPLGGRFGLTSWIRYSFYTQNRESGYPEGRIKLRNSVGKNCALGLEGAFLSGFYKKNYLSDVDDANKNGNITREERIYSPAIYDEYEGILEYEHNFIKDKEKRISGIDVRPFIGYNDRSYNSKFENRDQNIALLGVGFNIEFLAKIDLDMNYLYERVSSPNLVELILFDETISWIDVNDDGRIKGNAPLFTDIDRSCRRHTLEIDPSWELAKNFIIYAGYAMRTSDYTSENPLDYEHYGVEAFRQRFTAGTKYNISKAWSAEVEYGRLDDENDEDGNYSQNRIKATIRYKFN
jgi:hypothetical protein